MLHSKAGTLCLGYALLSFSFRNCTPHIAAKGGLQQCIPMDRALPVSRSIWTYLYTCNAFVVDLNEQRGPPSVSV